jgi:hypothetical protein
MATAGSSIGNVRKITYSDGKEVTYGIRTKYYGSADSPLGSIQESYVPGYNRFVIYWRIIFSGGEAGDNVTLNSLPTGFLNTNSVQVSHNILTFPPGDDGTVLQPYAPAVVGSTVVANLGVIGAEGGYYTGRTVFEFYPETQ